MLYGFVISKIPVGSTPHNVGSDIVGLLPDPSHSVHPDGLVVHEWRILSVINPSLAGAGFGG
jgi:hypothetical protein